MDGVDQPALRFFPAWDVRESWVPWVGWAFAGLVFWVVATAAWRLQKRGWQYDAPVGSNPAPWKAVASVVTMFLLGVQVATCSTGHYDMRIPLARGTAVYSDGTVANARFEGFGRTAWHLFDVSGQTFLMPYVNPHLCVPRDGERVRLWSSPRVLSAPQGTPSRNVLRMEMTRPCHIRPWG